MQDNEAKNAVNEISFIGEIDQVTQILVLWRMECNEMKSFSLKGLPEMIKSSGLPIEMPERVEAFLDYFCGNMEGRFIAGLYVIDPRSLKIIGACADTNEQHKNIFLVYRTALALKCFSRVDYPDDFIKVSDALDSREKHHEEGRRWLTRIIGESRYNEIMKAIPPDLELAVETMLRRGIRIDKAPFEAEIKKGLINSPALMKILKIKTPQELKEWQEHAEKIAEPYWKYVLEYMKFKNYPAQDEKISSSIKKCIYEVFARGIEDHVTVAGLALAMYSRRIQLRNILAEQELDEGEENYTPLPILEDEHKYQMLREAVRNAIADLSKDFAECFAGGKKPEDYEKLFNVGLINIDSMASVDL